METVLLLRNGEQLLLALVIPVLVLFAGTVADRPSGPLADAPAIDELTPGVLALAIMSTTFTSLAIATGFERRYGVLKRLGASPLPRTGCCWARSAPCCSSSCCRWSCSRRVALLLGWSPELTARGLAGVVSIAVLGTAAFASLGLLRRRLAARRGDAGRGEPRLHPAGGRRRGGAAGLDVRRVLDVVELLPSGALGGGMRESLIDGTFPLDQSLVLLAWAALGALLTARTFKWE